MHSKLPHADELCVTGRNNLSSLNVSTFYASREH